MKMNRQSSGNHRTYHQDYKQETLTRLEEWIEEQAKWEVDTEWRA